MKQFLEFCKDLYFYSKRKFIINIILSTLVGISNGVGVLLLIPLFALTGITGNGIENFKMFKNVGFSFKNFSPSIRLLLVLIIYVCIIVFQGLLNRKLSILNSEIIQGYTMHLRVSLYECINRASWSALVEKKKSDITNSFTIEIGRVVTATILFIRIISQIIIASFQVVVAFIMSVPITIFVLVSGIVLFLFMKSSVKESRKLGEGLRLRNQDLLSNVTEQLNGIKEVKSYGIEDIQIEKFNAVNSKINDNIVSFTKLQSKSEFYYKSGAAIIISVLFYMSINLFKIQPTAMFIIIFIFAKLWPMFSSFQNNLQNIFVAIPSFLSLKRLKKDLMDGAENNNTYSETEIFKLNNQIIFDNIGFKYYKDKSNESFALKNISFKIPARSMTAFVGKSGAGKSTLADIIIGILSPTEGLMTVDGIEIDENGIKGWRRCIGYVPQDPFLLNDTLKENLVRFTPRVTEEEIMEALELAAAKEFVEKLPEGINTIIGDRGVKLSGGERQRIVLARALLRKPEILVLDEATSALDNENEYKIQKAIDGLRGKLTVVVIAHRLSTIQEADNIIVLDKGQVVEEGNFDKLAKIKDGYFRKMLDVRNEC